MPLLDVERVTLRFGGLTALDRVSLAVAEGEIAGLIGPNGAGKTSLFNVISRLYRPQSGAVRFAGRDLARVAPHRLAAHGIGRTLQHGEAFGTLTVLDNVLVGARSGRRGGDARRRALEVLEALELRSLAQRRAGTLPFATQKLVGLARALAARPRLLLLDEPAAGLAHERVEALDVLIRSLRDRFETTILLVEHHMRLVMRLCERVHVLDSGRTIAEGEPEEIQQHPDVLEAYLGPDAPARA